MAKESLLTNLNTDPVRDVPAQVMNRQRSGTNRRLTVMLPAR